MMRDLKRNQTKISYKNYKGKEEILDADGYATGSFKRLYTEPKTILISVSANKGNAEVQGFGTQLDYDRTLSTSDMSCDINENSIVYIGSETYKVIKRADSLNQVQIALRKEEINEGN